MWLPFFFNYLSLFNFNCTSFYNKGIWVIIQTHFFHPSTFSFPTKQKRGKLKYFLFSYFSILSPFSIFLLFHHSNQTDTKNYHYFWVEFVMCLYIRTSFPLPYVCLFLYLKKKNHNFTHTHTHTHTYIYIERERERCYVHNIFTTNHRWLVVTGSNLNLTLRLLFYPNNYNQ